MSFTFRDFREKCLQPFQLTRELPLPSILEGDERQ